MDKSKTGVLIAQSRKEKDMTQKDLADLLHVSDRAISKWEREECYPDITLLPVLADAIGCKVDDFFTS